MNNRIMSHMVAYYPDEEKSFTVARALIDGGCSYLEVQFPFSDPSADGVLIQRACRTALEAGFRADGGFELISKIRKYSDVPVFIMSYANLVFFRGVEKFLRDCAETGVSGVIVPDLPPDSDEGLYSYGKRLNVKAVPVIMPNIEDKRLNMIIKHTEEYLYTAIRAGITGKFTKIDSSVLEFLKKVQGMGVKILAGFGISERSQVEAVLHFVHAAVVGSAFIKVIEQNGERNDPYDAVLKKIKELV
ncbi:MAG: tryptophan synthase subunit alpha [Spirochaetales bacterium]|nr:tryptophan synthase subunit alpha [Spirochaetales bacterium]